jgi:hypothetical protein
MILPLPGEMNKRCRILRVRQLPKDASDKENEQELLFEGWCKVEVIGGSVYWDNIQTEDAVTHRLYVRSIRGITRPQDLPRLIEIQCNGLRYRSKRITDCNGAGRFTLLECEVLHA